MYTQINAFVVESIRSMMVNSDVELCSGESNILFATFFTSYQVDQVSGSAAKIVPDCVSSASLCRSEIPTAVQMLACNTSGVVATFHPSILYAKEW